MRHGELALSERVWKRSLGVLTACAALGVLPAAAQDYSAGKTAAQLFASDCSACHKSPGGLAKGQSISALTQFLKEHYTTKEENAAALAAYLSGAGPGDAKLKADAPIGGAKSKPKNAEGDADQKTAPRPRAAAVEPPKAADGDTDTSIMREEAPKNPRAAAAARDNPGGQADPVVSKLKLYGAAGGTTKDTQRLGNPAKKLESYASSGSAADAITPSEAATRDAAVGGDARPKPKPKRKPSDKKDDSEASAAHAPRPHRAQAPIQPLPGNN
jgi:hypothetical protein